MAGKTLQEIYCWRLTSDNLSIFFASSDRGGLRIWLSLEKFKKPIDFFKERLPQKELVLDESANSQLIKAVHACLENSFLSIPPLDASFTPFENSVYNAILQIPYGETRQYNEVATMIGNPGGARAVGQAMKRNRFPIIFP